VTRDDERESLEATLIAGYRQELAAYQRALQAATELPAALHAASESSGFLEPLLSALEDVRMIDERLAQAKRQWNEKRLKPGKELAELLGQLTQTLECLQSDIARMESQALDLCAELLPALDAAARSRQMSRAYRGVSGPPESPGG
jgi:hypothetical protein